MTGLCPSSGPLLSVRVCVSIAETGQNRLTGHPQVMLGELPAQLQVYSLVGHFFVVHFLFSPVPQQHVIVTPDIVSSPFI